MQNSVEPRNLPQSNSGGEQKSQHPETQDRDSTPIQRYLWNAPKSCKDGEDPGSREHQQPIDPGASMFSCDALPALQSCLHIFGFDAMPPTSAFCCFTPAVIF